MAAVAPTVYSVVNSSIDCAYSFIIVVWLIPANKIVLKKELLKKLKPVLTAIDDCTADKAGFDRELCYKNYNFAR